MRVAALDRAVREGNAERAVLLYRAAPPERYGWTALHCAAFYGKPRVARALVAAGADPSDGALELAASQGELATVETLLELGARPSPADAHDAAFCGFAACAIAIARRDASVLSFVKRPGRGPPRSVLALAGDGPYLCMGSLRWDWSDEDLSEAAALVEPGKWCRSARVRAAWRAQAGVGVAVGQLARQRPGLRGVAATVAWMAAGRAGAAAAARAEHHASECEGELAAAAWLRAYSSPTGSSDE